jgi:16S rRNA (guanine1516-N2)-methyltransferase
LAQLCGGHLFYGIGQLGVMNLDLPPEFRLEHQQDRLQLVHLPSKMKPIYIDFSEDGRTLEQVRRKLGRRNPLFRAVGALSDTQTIWDCTAGFAQDAFYLAVMGYQVTAIERSPVLFALIEDAIRRAGQIEGYAEVVRDRLHIVHRDAIEYLRETQGPLPNAIYLDPMYPHQSRKSALPRKEMVWLRQLVGDDDNGVALLHAARALVVPRVVVKRPLKSEPLLPQVTHSFKGQTTRYDLYV